MEINTRRAIASVSYNGISITADIEKKTTSLTYTDNEGASDELSITVENSDGRWLNSWLPQKGDRLFSEISVYDWLYQGDNRKLILGEFCIDDISGGGPPDTMSIGAVSQPKDLDFNIRKRSKTWEKVTIKQIAYEIALRANMTSVYDAGEITIDSKEQNEETDSAFLKAVCDEYALSLKIYSSKIVIYNRQAYKNKPSVLALNKTDMESYSFNMTLEGAYTGGVFSYTDEKTEEDIKIEIGTGPRILNINEKADNAADAETKLKAALNNANEDITTMSFSIMGNPSIAAGTTVDISGFGALDGKYYLKRVTHSIGDGYKTSCEASRCEISF